MVEIVSGNLLDAQADALVNTVNTVGIMGKGIALQFKRAFPDNFSDYKHACDHGEVRLGRMFVHENRSLHGPRFIINFPTKSHWKGASRLEEIQAGLHDLVETVNKFSIKSIAVPPLGCGLGGLAWNEVRQAIEKALNSLPNVKVLLYTPAGAPDAYRLTHSWPRKI